MNTKMLSFSEQTPATLEHWISQNAASKQQKQALLKVNQA